MSTLNTVRYVLFVGFALCCFASSLYGQTSASVWGRVTDTDSRPLRGATVDLVGKDQSLVTDEGGEFRFAVPAGAYTVRISMMGYESKTVKNSFGKDLPSVFVLRKSTVGLDEVVVTATRTEKNVADIPLPMTVVGQAEIRQKAMVRLSEVLAEQPGIILTDNHGTGIQLQGFEPKYTLVLIDGEPVIGRTAGILEVSRVTMANVDRVEILKGPSSSLYGSEAMAGVVNIITQKPGESSRAGASVRYGTNSSLDLSVDGSMAGNKTSVYGAFNRFSNGGYHFGGGNTAQTVPPFYGYTGNIKADYVLTAKLTAKIGLKYNDEHASERYLTSTGTGSEEDVTSKFLRRDIAITPGAVYRHSDRHTTSLRINKSLYKTDTRISIAADGNLYSDDSFDQDFSKVELQHDHKANDHVQLTAGAGISDEWLKAERYGDKKEYIAGFGYAQADVRVSERLNFIAGGRFDAHNVYASEFSPKLAAQYKALSWLTAHGSVGSGFKAPDFRELYLNWTNPTHGYSVFGSEDVAQRLKQLVEAGEITEVLLDPDRIKPLRAERSWNYQAGIKLHPGKGIHGGLSLFQHQVGNLIETFAIANKTNGRSVYTYSNQESVSIQGAEAHLNYTWRALRVQTGAQYLVTANKDVLDAIRARRGYYMRDPATGNSRLVKRSEYGGLLNRSRYTANTSVAYNWAEPMLSLTFRWAYRNRFGIRDIDGNGILNLDGEYAPGYSIFNASAVKSFFNSRFSVSFSTENIGNIRHTGIATMPGRMFFIGIAYSANSSHNFIQKQ